MKKNSLLIADNREAMIAFFEKDVDLHREHKQGIHLQSASVGEA